MEFYFNLFLLFLQGVIIVLFFIFKNTAPSYLKKKAEDLATLEDIGRITKEVKSVEHEFSEKLSIFQADLNILKSHSQKLGDEERDLLIRLYQACNKVDFSIKHIKPKSAGNYQLAEIQNEVAKWTAFMEIVIEIRSNLELFVINSELKKNANSFINHFLTFSGEIKRNFSLIYRGLEKVQAYKKTIEVVNNTIEKAVKDKPPKERKIPYVNQVQQNIIKEQKAIQEMSDSFNGRVENFIIDQQELKRNS